MLFKKKTTGYKFGGMKHSDTLIKKKQAVLD